MPRPLTDDQIRRLRLRGQQLLRDAEDVPDVAAVVRQVGGLQAQDLPAALLSARARCRGLTAEAMEHALLETRSLVRTWLMRGTIHLVAAEDIGWLLAVFGPRFNNTSRRRREQLGLDDETAIRGACVLEDVLHRRGPLTRAEIRAEPALEAVPLDGQAAPHLIRYAALEGRLCYGPWQDGEPAYAALTAWIDRPAPPPEHEALALLTRRYLRAYGPATPRDMATWSGLTLGPVREGFERIEDELAEVVVEGETAWMLTEETQRLDDLPRRFGTRLLPKYDTLLLGYRSRDWILPAAHAKRICPGGGLLRRSVLADGRIVGTWDPVRYGDDLRVVVELFEDISPAARDELEVDAEDVGRFLGHAATLEMA